MKQIQMAQKGEKTEGLFSYINDIGLSGK